MVLSTLDPPPVIRVCGGRVGGMVVGRGGGPCVREVPPRSSRFARRVLRPSVDRTHSVGGLFRWFRSPRVHTCPCCLTRCVVALHVCFPHPMRGQARGKFSGLSLRHFLLWR